MDGNGVAAVTEIAGSQWRNWIGGLAFSASLAAFGVGVIHSPIIDDALALERVVINKHARCAYLDLVRERALAGAYWQRNPDVAQDRFFAVDGALGTFGAREHYDRLGRQEGRHWGL